MSRDILDWLMTNPAPAATTRVPYGPDPLNFGDVRLPKGAGPHPVVVVIHGGSWKAKYDLAHIGHACAALTARGVATWSVEYRRVGNPGGGWPGTFQDVGQAIDFLREIAPRYDLDLTRVVAIGHSAGGHLALWAAGRSRIPVGDPLHAESPFHLMAVVSLAGVGDLRRAWQRQQDDRSVAALMGGGPDEVPMRYAMASPAELLPLGVRQVLIHGTEDAEVPFAEAEGYWAARAAGDDVTLVRLPGTGHFEVIDPLSPEWSTVADVVFSAV
jgi:acetyl esterase/lipase